jgi:hypothetical protein
VQLAGLRWLEAWSLIAMGFRSRRSARPGPPRFNFAKGGLSSISIGGRGASFNIPVSRSDGPRTTVGLPGSGLSWYAEHTAKRQNEPTRRAFPLARHRAAQQPPLPADL